MIIIRPFGVALLAVLSLMAYPTWSIEIIHQTATVSATADGVTDSASLSPNDIGGLLVEMGTPGGSADYGKGTLASSFSATHIDLMATTDIDHFEQFGSATADIEIRFVVTTPTLYSVTPFAQAGGSGWLGYLSNFVLTDSEGFVWEYNSEEGYMCHPIRFELCPLFNPVLAVGEYTLTLTGGPSYYPPECGSCGGYAVVTSTSVRFDFPGEPPAEHLLGIGQNELSWNAPADAQYYDVVRGDLGALRASGGDFSNADELCLTDDDPNLTLPYPAVPPVGEGWWFLVRKTGDLWGGSWDSPGTGQSGSRNVELSAASAGCP